MSAHTTDRVLITYDEQGALRRVPTPPTPHVCEVQALQRLVIEDIQGVVKVLEIADFNPPCPCRCNPCLRFNKREKRGTASDQKASKEGPRWRRVTL